LASRLASSDDACLRYVVFVHLCVDLSYPSAGARHSGHDGLAEIPGDLAAAKPLALLADVEPLSSEGGPSASVRHRTSLNSPRSPLSVRNWAAGTCVALLVAAIVVWVQVQNGQPDDARENRSVVVAQESGHRGPPASK